MIGFFNNWNIITLSHKSRTSGAFEEIHQVILDGISDNMALLFRSGNYGSMKTTYTSTMGYYVINFVLDTYTLQYDTTNDVKISSSIQLFFKAQNLSCMQ